jgi:Ca2+-binding EF-hand superfamily protein
MSSVEERELGPMYELFDKDSNGVIDLEEFVGELSDCPKPVLQLLNRLLMDGHFYDELADRLMFSGLISDFSENP